jgi:hypothetical protein
MHIDATSRQGTLEDVLIALGRNILIALMSPALLRLCYTAIIEAERYPRAAAVYHEQGLAPTMATLAEILEKANEKGETRIVDCRRAAGQFHRDAARRHPFRSHAGATASSRDSGDRGAGTIRDRRVSARREADRPRCHSACKLTP